MSKRITHSLLDPYFAPLVPRLYAALSIPRRFPPEAIVGIGHLLAIAGAFGFALDSKETIDFDTFGADIHNTRVGIFVNEDIGTLFLGHRGSCFA